MQDTEGKMAQDGFLDGPSTIEIDCRRAVWGLLGDTAERDRPVVGAEHASTRSRGDPGGPVGLPRGPDSTAPRSGAFRNVTVARFRTSC